MKLYLDIIIRPIRSEKWEDLSMRQQLNTLRELGVEDCAWIQIKNDLLHVHGAELSDDIKALTLGQILEHDGDVGKVMANMAETID